MAKLNNPISLDTNFKDKRGTILVAPLNWGLGHATRCIPIIRKLLHFNFEVIIASDGQALELLKKEFTMLRAIVLPSYNIKYSNKGEFLKYKLLADSPKILKAIKEERVLLKTLVEKYGITGIISDNRYGIYHKKIPSVFITHQIKVLSGKTTWISSKLNKRFLKKFDAIWVPDYTGINSLSGKMSNAEGITIPVDFIGPQSRFTYFEIMANRSIDILVIISGPEPQRTQFETLMINAFKSSGLKVILVRGKIEETVKSEIEGSIKIYNFLTTEKLQTYLNLSKLVICRSGYSSIMDLAKLGKRAFFVPTPGQYEQVYLAKRMKKLNIADYCSQEDFALKKLESIEKYNGFEPDESISNYRKLFRFFEGE